jgi:shikimate dehydrogenase
LKDAKKSGNIAVNGKLMFIYQAHSAFNIWHGIKPDINEDVIKYLD